MPRQRGQSREAAEHNTYDSNSGDGRAGLSLVNTNVHRTPTLIYANPCWRSSSMALEPLHWARALPFFMALAIDGARAKVLASRLS